MPCQVLSRYIASAPAAKTKCSISCIVLNLCNAAIKATCPFMQISPRTRNVGSLRDCLHPTIHESGEPSMKNMAASVLGSKR